jgi:hypothetical protein
MFLRACLFPNQRMLGTCFGLPWFPYHRTSPFASPRHRLPTLDSESTLDSRMSVGSPAAAVQIVLATRASTGGVLDFRWCCASLSAADAGGHPHGVTIVSSDNEVRFTRSTAGDVSIGLIVFRCYVRAGRAARRSSHSRSVAFSPPRRPCGDFLVPSEHLIGAGYDLERTSGRTCTV